MNKITLTNGNVVDLGNPVDHATVQSRLLDMLLAFARYCDNNGIRYRLAGGTLLGAIRHKGFIPWDDDVDVNIPRPDYEQLHDASPDSFGGYELVFPGQGWDDGVCFARLFDHKYCLQHYTEANVKNNWTPLCIDVFPVDGLPDTEKECRARLRKVKLWAGLYRTAALGPFYGKTFPRKCFHLVQYCAAMLASPKRCLQKHQALLAISPYADSNFVGGISGIPENLTRERIDRIGFETAVDVEFERRAFHAPSNYNRYLTQLYGDYMQLPHEENRKSHDFVVYECSLASQDGIE